MKLTDDKFFKKSEKRADPAPTRKSIRAAMHEAASYEQAFDLLAQAGGPNMLQQAPSDVGGDSEAPMADPNQVTDISDVWPEADIMKQTHDMRNQGMDDRKIFTQLIEMGALGSPKPMAQDLEYLNQIMRSAQLGTGPAGTAAVPMNGQRDTLSSEEIPGTGKIEAAPAPNQMPSLKQVMVDDSHRYGPGAVTPPQEQQKLPSMQQQQDRAQEYADFMPPSTTGHQPIKRAQALPPAQPPTTPPAAPAAPGTPEEGAPPAAPGEDMEMGEEEMAIDDMRSLSEVMEELATDVEVIQQKLEDGETMIHGQDAVPMEDDAGPMPSGPPKIAVDQPAKKYYEDYFGDYGHQLAEDRVASIIDIIDEVAPTHNFGADITDIAYFVASRPQHKAEVGDAKFTEINDKIMIDWMHQHSVALGSTPAFKAVSVATANAFFRAAIATTTHKVALVKYAEGKMKTPSVKGQSDDAVKQDKLKDNAKDKGLERRRPAHLPMKVLDITKSGVYTCLLIEWDPDHDSAKRSDSGMEQAVVSYVKGLESHKEFKDLGFLGQITIDELDIEAGQATVHFRTMKPADAPTVVREE